MITDLTVSPAVRVVFTEDGAVLMNIESGSIFSLNMIGGSIWKFLAADQTREEIADSLSRECNVSREEVLVDLDEFVEELIKYRLLEAGGRLKRRA